MTKQHEPASPHLWDNRLGWGDNLQAFTEHAYTANYELNLAYGTEVRQYIDELAVLAPNREMVLEFVDDAVGNGWTYFNRASDTVRAEPFGTVYAVEYHFLRHPNYPWRFEVMRKMSGVSPVHDAMKSFMDDGLPLVHASFKPMNGESEESYALAQASLNEAGYCLAQECRGTYGRFGYWRAVNDPLLRYLKPRINTRDSIMHSMCTTDSHDGCMS